MRTDCRSLEITCGALYHVEYIVEDDQRRVLSFRAIAPDYSNMSDNQRRNVVRQLRAGGGGESHVLIRTLTRTQTEDTLYWWCVCETAPWVGHGERFLRRHLKPVVARWVGGGGARCCMQIFAD